MKVVLIPWYLNKSDNTNNERIIPLGLMTISLFLKSNGHETIIYDLNLRRYLSVREMSEELLNLNANVYGFSVAAGTLHTALQIAEQIKEYDPDRIIVFGGPHPTLVYDKLIKNFDFIDYIVRGEGEITLLELLNTLEKNENPGKVKGIVFRNNEDICITGERELINELDYIEMPDYDSYLVESQEINSVPIEVGRGCPFSCSYCASSVLWQRKFRVKSVKRIINELEYIYKRYGVTMYYFRHDQIVINRDWLINLCNEIKNKLPNIKWQCSARIDTIDPDLLKVMKESGCVSIEFGLESFSHSIQKSIEKNLLPEKIEKNLEVVIEEGINPILFFMCGFPEETYEDLQRTLNAILRLCSKCKQSTFFQLRVLQPFPKTKVKATDNSALEFSINRLPDEIIKTYTTEQIKLAKEDSDLFPEFYYIKNKNGISLKEFLYIEKLFNSVIRFYNTHYFLVFKYILHFTGYEYKELFKLLSKHINLQTLSHINENDLVDALHEIVNDLSYLEWLKDIFVYENEIRKKSINYTKTIGTDNLCNNSILVTNPNFEVFKFTKNIYQIIDILRENKFDLLENFNDDNEENYLAIYAVSKDNILTIKIDKGLADIINRFKQPKNFSEFIGDDNLCNLIKQLVERKVLINDKS